MPLHPPILADNARQPKCWPVLFPRLIHEDSLFLGVACLDYLLARQTLHTGNQGSAAPKLPMRCAEYPPQAAKKGTVPLFALVFLRFRNNRGTRVSMYYLSYSAYLRLCMQPLIKIPSSRFLLPFSRPLCNFVSRWCNLLSFIHALPEVPENR